MNKIYLIAILLISIKVLPQSPGSISLAFPFKNNFTSNSIAIKTNGKLLVGGDEYLGGVSPCNKLFLLNSDGTKDMNFNDCSFSGVDLNTADDAINSIAIQSDEKIIVGGQFITYNGISQNRLIRLNSDGTKDITFDIGTGFNGDVNCILIQSDGKLLIGGKFTTFNGTSQNNLVRLNADGTKDNSFDIGTGFLSTSAIVSSINTITIQSDGKIITGGYFSTFNSSPYLGNNKNIVRLNSNGTLDATFDISGAELFSDGYVNSVAIQSDGKILVGGYLLWFNGVTWVTNHLARLNQNGSKDNSFNTCAICENSGFVKDIKIQSNNKIVVGFSPYNNESQGLLRLNSDGTQDSNFILDSGYKFGVWQIAIQNDGKILTAGHTWGINNSNTILINGLNRIKSDGTTDYSFNTNSYGMEYNTSINSIISQTDGKIIIGGSSINTYDGFLTHNLIRIKSNGKYDETFNIDSNYILGGINFLKIQPNGKILVAGSIFDINANQVYNLVRLNSDGTKDNSFNSAVIANVFSISLQSDGRILVGGGFSLFNGISQNGLIRLNSDGTKDISFDIGTGFNSFVNSLSIQSDGKILVGGYFSNFNGVSQNKLIRLNTDGTKDNSFNIASGFNGTVNSIIIQSDCKILVGGVFYTYNGISQNRLIRLNSDGTKDSAFEIGTGFDNAINSIALQSDGRILVGGNFTLFNGISQNRLIRLNSDGTKDISFDIGTGFDYSVNSIAIEPLGGICIGGDFTNYNLQNSYKLVKINADSNLNLDSFNKNIIQIYPNPATDLVNIKINFIEELKGGNINIINSLGQKVSSTPIIFSEISNNFTINTSSWGNKGLFFIQFLNSNGKVIEVKKILLE